MRVNRIKNVCTVLLIAVLFTAVTVISLSVAPTSAQANPTPEMGASFSVDEFTRLSQSSSVITIGVSGPLSGPVAFLGWHVANSVQLAISQTNAAGGINIGGIPHTVVLVTADDACDSTQAVTAANTLLNAGAVAVIGHVCSSASIAAQSIYNAAGVPMVSATSTNPELTQQGYTTTFRTISHDNTPPALLATYLRNRAHLATSAIADSPWGEPVGVVYSNTFTALGGTITSRRMILNTSDFTDTLTAIQAEDPDVIFYTDPDPVRGGQLSRIATSLGMTNVVIGWNSMSWQDAPLTAYADAAGAAAVEGDYAAMSYRRATDMPGWATFLTDYQAAGFAQEPDYPDIEGAYAYDAARIVMAAIERAGSIDPGAIRNQIAATGNTVGVVGAYHGFDEHGDVIPQWAWLERYQDGQWVTALANTGITVGVVLPTQSQSRWVKDGAQFQAALSAAGYASQVLFSQNLTTTEKTNVEALLAQGIQVLIICPVDSFAAAAAVEEARAAGVKVIVYDRLILNTPAVDYYVSFIATEVGAAQGQYLVDAATGAGNPLYLYAGHPGDNNAFLFFEGSWAALQPKLADGTFVIMNSSAAVALQTQATLTHDEAASILAEITTNWDPGTASALAQANLAAVTAAGKGDVFILAPADFVARAIGDVFAADPDVSSYVITGQDAERATVQYIIEGKQTMTVLKDVRTLVKDAAAAAVTILQGGTPIADTAYNNGAIDVPTKASALVSVDKHNLKAALIDTDYYQLSDFNWTTYLAVLPTAGTTMISPFDATTYRFALGTFTDVVLVTHTTTFSATAPGNRVEIGHSFDITAVYSNTGLPAQPTKPYTITIQYTDEQIGALDESALAFYFWIGNQWVREPTRVEPDANTIIATPDHFSSWVVMGEILRKVYLPLVVKDYNPGLSYFDRH